MTAQPLLGIEGLTVEFKSRRGTVQAVRDVSFAVGRGRIVGVVGESGSGKSVSSYAVLRILDRAGRVVAGQVDFAGVDVLGLSEAAMADLRGREIAMVFQNPRASLNPVRRIGRQIADVLVRHAQATRATAPTRVIELLRTVRINDPERRAEAYPFELSGGMCQRVSMAIALACSPRLLIADEPTTGLDVTTQKAVMDLLVELARARDMATVLITHDLGLAAAYCDDLVIMQEGRVVEAATAAHVFAAPAHAYTRRLLRATPRPGASLTDLLPPDALHPSRPDPAPGGPLLEAQSLSMRFPGGVQAVDDVSFALRAGESVGLVGESGSGKSTTAAMLMRLLDPTSGTIRLEGRSISAVPARHFATDPDRRELQLVFQDASDSLNPRHTAARSIMDPLLRLAGQSRKAARMEAEALADQVGLPRALLDRFPHQISGGQKARVGIARAIALRPRLLILDEPTAALDVSVQAVVLNLLADLRTQTGMAYLFVSHDLHVVRLMCQRVLVMQGGRIVEQGETAQVMQSPTHDYTRTLLAALPHPPQAAQSVMSARPEATHAG